MSRHKGWKRQRARVEYPCVKNGVQCPDRHPGCQDHCEAFLKASAENERLREAEHKLAAIESAYRGSIRRACRDKKKY